MGNPDGIARRCRLPNDEFGPAWTSIKLADGVHDRLLAQSLLSFIIRQKLPFEAAPLHGLILLKAPPGTGKTTLGRGLANQVAKQLPGAKCTFIEVDPHALTSSALGRSQQAVAKLFEQTIPELAMDGAALVLIDELESGYRGFTDCREAGISPTLQQLRVSNLLSVSCAAVKNRAAAHRGHAWRLGVL